MRAGAFQYLIWKSSSCLHRPAGEFSKAGSKRRIIFQLMLCFLVRLTPAFACDCICENKMLQQELGSEVYNVVRDYINRSPIITGDLEKINCIGRIKNKRNQISIWMDYSAELFLDIQGNKGRGELNLQIAGNNYKSIDSFKGQWSFAHRVSPLNNEGKVDEFAVKGSKLEELKAELDSAEKAEDCQTIIKLISKNRKENKNSTAYSLDHKLSTRLLAQCYEKAGDLDSAALEFGRLGFFSSPYPFKIDAYSQDKIDTAREYYNKAISLGNDARYISNWKLRLKQLEIQRQQLSDPDNEKLHSELCEILAQQKIYYTVQCPNIRKKLRPAD